MKVLCNFWKKDDQYMLPSCGRDTTSRWWKERDDRKVIVNSQLASSFNESFKKYFGELKEGSIGYIYKQEILLEVND